MTQSEPASPALRRFAFLAAVMTFILVWLGGLVTSHNAGMAVPDWPNTYGYNMFFFSASRWIGGIFYEHTHRLAASLVGLFTAILALWFFGKPARPFLRWAGMIIAGLGVLLLAVMPARWQDALVALAVGLAAVGASFFWPACEPSPRWMKRLGLVALGAVVLQGVLGGLRVTLIKDEIGIFHAALAQLFFVLLSAIALFQTNWWNRVRPSLSGAGRIARIYVFLGGLVFAQLLLGATMRHQHAGLAIPDFPAAYGRIWPATDADSILRYNQQRAQVGNDLPVTALQIGLQMGHRAMAIVILGGALFAFWATRRMAGRGHFLNRLAGGIVMVVLLQALLGAATIWTGKSADIATAHVAVGASLLMLTGLTTLISFRLRPAAREGEIGGTVEAGRSRTRQSEETLVMQTL